MRTGHFVFVFFMQWLISLLYLCHLVSSFSSDKYLPDFSSKSQAKGPRFKVLLLYNFFFSYAIRASMAAMTIIVLSMIDCPREIVPVQEIHVCVLWQIMLCRFNLILTHICLNCVSSQCARGKSSIARKPEVHPKILQW